ncbi:MAG TPA: hypothetical protein VEU62_16175 [Bryobacterales bacterium]|nr:hypothetical protein [Bryobacterales bacterium]
MARDNPPEQEREEPDLYPYVDLRRARLCLDCEMIFDAPQCPACTSESFVPVTRWIRPTERRAAERPAAAPPAQAGAPPPKKPFRFLKKSVYLGLGAYGAWKMLFDPSRPRRRKLPEPEDEE